MTILWGPEIENQIPLNVPNEALDFTSHSVFLI